MIQIMDGLIVFEKEANDRYIINVIGVFIVLQIATNDRYANDGKNGCLNSLYFDDHTEIFVLDEIKIKMIKEYQQHLLLYIIERLNIIYN